MAREVGEKAGSMESKRGRQCKEGICHLGVMLLGGGIDEDRSEELMG